MKRAWLLGGCLLGSVMVGHAADTQGLYAIKGAGITSCGSFVQAAQAKNNLYFAYGGWLEGYLTAYNRAQRDTFDLAPWQSTALLLKVTESFCKRSSDMKFHQAVDIVLKELQPQRTSESTGYVKLGTSEQPVVLQKEVIARIQKALLQKGFLTSVAVLGDYDDATSDALKAFQKSMQHTETGVPEQSTLFELFKGVTLN